MASVLQLTRKLQQRPEIAVLEGVTLRHFAGPSDVDLWLEIRHRAFARQKVGVRHWDRADFEAEFLDKAWWRPQAMWFAEVSDSPGSAPRAAGTVTMAWRQAGQQSRPVVHWLAVLPEFRRHGIGRLLLATLETACWDAGERQIWLETHVGWREAVKLYEAAGYRIAD